MAIDGGFVGINGRRQMEDLSLANPGAEPGELFFLDDRHDGRNARPGPGMRDPSLAGPIIQRPQDRSIRAEVLDDAAKARLDLTVDLLGGTRGKGGGEVREESLEAEPVGEASLGAATLGALHEEEPDEQTLEDHQACRPDDV